MFRTDGTAAGAGSYSWWTNARALRRQVSADERIAFSGRVAKVAWAHGEPTTVATGHGACVAANSA
jgi:uncharacterized tellurite resistance protein B-like protein